jgi:hypothetical protein
MSGVTDMKLVGPNFTKDVILQIFTFLDTGEDPFLSVLRDIKIKRAPRPNTSGPRIDNKPKKPTHGLEFVKTLEDIAHGEGLSIELQRYMQRTKNF